MDVTFKHSNALFSIQICHRDFYSAAVSWIGNRRILSPHEIVQLRHDEISAHSWQNEVASAPSCWIRNRSVVSVYKIRLNLIFKSSTFTFKRVWSTESIFCTSCCGTVGHCLRSAFFERQERAGCRTSRVSEGTASSEPSLVAPCVSDRYNKWSSYHLLCQLKPTLGSLPSPPPLAMQLLL